MSTLGERIEETRGVVTARGTRIGMPSVDTTLAMLDRLETTFTTHRFRESTRPWCLRCLEDWPCAEVAAAEGLLQAVERTERGG